jgi:hypothetical protein
MISVAAAGLPELAGDGLTSEAQPTSATAPSRHAIAKRGTLCNIWFTCLRFHGFGQYLARQSDLPSAGALAGEECVDGIAVSRLWRVPAQAPNGVRHKQVFNRNTEALVKPCQATSRGR